MAKPFEGNLSGTCLLFAYQMAAHCGPAAPLALPALAGDASGFVKTAIRPRGGVIGRFTRYRPITRRGGRSARTCIALMGGSDAWP
jgi:hypothetical protein